MDSVVPLPPAGVCFKREKFIQADFSADVFLQDLWNSVPLEVLRDDLGSYLKVLRSAMIELINRDYADFVNLSGNLVGLDVAISNLQQPLISIETEIMDVEKILKNVHSILQITLSERQCVREKKLLLESIMKIPASLDNLEKLLNLTKLEPINIMLEDDPSKGNVIARAANEFNQLQHLLMKCSSSQMMITDFQQRISEVNASLMKCLESTLFYGIENKKSDIVQKTLHTFATLDRCNLCVNLVRIHLVHPTLEKILNQQSLKKEPQDLNGLLNKMKNFINTNLKDLLTSTSHEGLEGFFFVEDCLWPEFCSFLLSDLDCIFAQGDPDLFHKRYSCTMEFVQYLESFSKRNLKKDSNYNTLISRWNLPVYFQMRFQELAGALETALITPLKELKPDESKGDLQSNFISTDVLLSGLASCYATDIYLSPLGHRFWKLSLQMMARYHKTISNLLVEQFKFGEGNSNTTVGTSFNQTGSEMKLSETDPVSGYKRQTKLTLHQLVQLDSDIRLIVSKLPSIWGLAANQLSLLEIQDLGIFENAFKASSAGFEGHLLDKISELIITELSLQCALHLKHVTDIPRLFRRTNKDIPTKPFSYVDQLLVPVREFHAKHKNQGENATRWILGVLKALSIQYLAAVSDVLTSVQKTEESLKRLRKERTAQTSNNGTSDDDKIRMQLVIDVDSFVKDAQSMSIDLLPELKALLDAVENARNLSRK